MKGLDLEKAKNRTGKNARDQKRLKHNSSAMMDCNAGLRMEA